MRSDNPMTVACLCAAWCRTCDGYAAIFRQAMASHPDVQALWIDIEDQSDLLGDFDVQTFPTLVIADAEQVFFAGPLTPQPETLRRVLRAALASAGEGRTATPTSADVRALAQRLRDQAAAGGDTVPAVFGTTGSS